MVQFILYICIFKVKKKMSLQKQNMVQKNSSVALHRKEAFEIGYKGYFKNLTSNKISTVLNDKERKIKFENITYRQLNSWEKEGLLTNDREDRSWRKFSIMDAIWARVIQELREFGMSWEQIATAKQSLEIDSAEYGVQMPILEFYTAFAIGNKMPVLLLVFKDGICVPANYTQYKVAREFSNVDNHLQINLNAILQSFFPTIDLKPKNKLEISVDMEEMELLAFIRIGEFEKIEIQFAKGKMQVVEGTERINANQILRDVIKAHKYQKIEVVVEDGKKVKLIRKVKKKLDKKG